MPKKSKKQKDRENPQDSVLLKRLQDKEEAFKLRGNARRCITNTCKFITKTIEERGSRTLVSESLKEATEAYNLTKSLNASLTDAVADPVQFDKQDGIQKHYLKLIKNADDEVDAYLKSRVGDKASTVAQSHRSDSSSSEDSEEEKEKALKAEKRRKRIEKNRQAAIKEAAEAEALFIAAKAKIADADQEEKEVEEETKSVKSKHSKPRSSSASHREEDYNSKVSRWDTTIPKAPVEETSPDSWIDDYVLKGTEPKAPVGRDRSSSSVKHTLSVFSGKSIHWFTYIDEIRTWIHETNKSPGEKLSLVKASLRGNALLSVEGYGADESAYKFALTTLKQQFGRRDVMKLAHLSELESLSYNKNDSSAFHQFANQVRVHLFSLSRIGETYNASIIEKICGKLNPQDLLDWNMKKGFELETRTLNEFGTWLCIRSAAYQNAYSIAEEQRKGDRSTGRDRRHTTGRAHQLSAIAEDEHVKNAAKDPVKTYEKRKAICFQCHQDSHRLPDCKEFKALSLSDKRKFVLKHRLCFCCFGTRHNEKSCRWFKGCAVANCALKHHTLLHDYSTSTSAGGSATFTVENEKTVKTTTLSTRSVMTRVALGVIRVEAYASDGSLQEVNVMFDEGADTTLFREGLINSLKLVGTKQKLNIDGAAGVQTKGIDSQLVVVKVKAAIGDLVLEGSTLPTVTRRVPVVDWNLLRHKWKHLNDLPLKKSGGVVDILLGCDYAHLMIPLEPVREAGQFAPVASRTALGWMVRGVIGKDTRLETARIHQLCAGVYEDQLDSETSTLTEEFRQFCSTENFGTEHTVGALSLDDRRAVTIVEEGLVKLDVGYQAPIPWRLGEPSFQLNRPLAESRLKFGVFKKFANPTAANPNYEVEYRGAMKKNFDKCYAEFLEDDDPSPRYFLPHHGVYKSKYDRKLRVVFDGKAKWQGKCLNDGIHSGPALQNDLPSVFIRFMESEIAFAADIEGMFPKVRLSREDSNHQCFLWPDETGRIRVARMNRLTFGLACSPYIAIRTMHRVAETVCKEDPEVRAMIEDNFYVDDLLASRPTLDGAIRVATGTSKALATGDFHLQGWTSNSTEFLEALDPVKPISSAPAVPLFTKDKEKLLGIYWKPRVDKLTFNVRDSEDVDFTRVGILSKVAEHLDPLGLAAPMTVKAKIRMQKDTMKYANWNDELLGEDRDWWVHWFQEMKKLNLVELPRCLFPDQENTSSRSFTPFVTPQRKRMQQ